MDDQLIERYTQRDCEQLAITLSQLTGWPVVVVSDGQTENFIGYIHAGVLTPRGTVLDVQGEHEPDEWLDHYAAYLDIDHRHDPDWDGTDSELVVVDRPERIGVPLRFQPDDETAVVAERLVLEYHNDPPLESA